MDANGLKSEAFKLLREMNIAIDKKKNRLIEEGCNELEVEAKLLFCKEIQTRSRQKVINGIEKMEFFIKN